MVIPYTPSKCNSRSIHERVLIHDESSDISALDFFNHSKPMGVRGIFVSQIRAHFHNSGLSHSSVLSTGSTRVVNFPYLKKWEIDQRYHSKI